MTEKNTKKTNKKASHRPKLSQNFHTLEETRSQLAAIVESSADAIIGKNLDGVITSWNSGAERIYGYTSKEILGRSISILAPQDRPDEALQILKKIKRSEFWDLDEVDYKLHKMIVDAYERVRDTAEKFKVDWRTAAHIVAISRLEIVYKERGIFP